MVRQERLVSINECVDPVAPAESYKHGLELFKVADIPIGLLPVEKSSTQPSSLI